DWGDGSDLDTGTVSGSNGSFTVKGSHTYTANGQYTVTVGIDDDIPAPAQIGTIVSKAIVGLAPGQFLLTSIVEGDSNSPNVAPLSDANSSDTAADFTASVVWGDGATTAGTVSGASGAFTVSGIHAYADEGVEPVAVTLTRTADQETATVAGDTSVGEADGFALNPDNFNGNPGIAINHVPVPTFTH